MIELELLTKIIIVVVLLACLFALFMALFSWLVDKEITALKLKGPRLGLATTREMLEELKARGQMGEYTRQFSADHLIMLHMSEECLNKFNEDTLNYRTVDHVT